MSDRQFSIILQVNVFTTLLVCEAGASLPRSIAAAKYHTIKITIEKQAGYTVRTRKLLVGKIGL